MGINLEFPAQREKIYAGKETIDRTGDTSRRKVGRKFDAGRDARKILLVQVLGSSSRGFSLASRWDWCLNDYQ